MVLASETCPPNTRTNGTVKHSVPNRPFILNVKVTLVQPHSVVVLSAFLCLFQIQSLSKLHHQIQSYSLQSLGLSLSSAPPNQNVFNPNTNTINGTKKQKPHSPPSPVSPSQCTFDFCTHRASKALQCSRNQQHFRYSIMSKKLFKKKEAK